MSEPTEDPIHEEMGGLLWRRVYRAHAELDSHVLVLASTLEALLKQAGVPEPPEDERE